MSERIPYIAVAPGLAEQKHVEAIGKAEMLFLFLVHHQRDADGTVNYGKPISYGWIQRRFAGTKRRTLARWMERLRAGGYISTTRTGHGFLVRILHQKKFPPRQLPLFPAPDPLLITRGKACDKPEIYEKREVPQVAHQMCHKWRIVS
jgi:hypothetical protein